MEVEDHRRDHQLDRDRRDHRPVLEEHRDRRVEEVVDALQRVEEREPPEADQRQPVAPDRLLEQDRHEVVHQPPAQRGDEQADQVVDEQPAHRAGGGAGDEVLGHEVAHRVGQERPDEGRQEVPEADVERPLDLGDRGDVVDRHQQQAELGDRVDPDRRLAPLQRLGLAQEQARRPWRRPRVARPRRWPRRGPSFRPGSSGCRPGGASAGARPTGARPGRRWR